MASKKKLLTSAVALGTAAALTLGGTFAWQSINQTAVNEGSDIVNPGGRLHDDYNGETGDKDVYVENFTTGENGGENIYARIRLEEYFKVAVNTGHGNKAESDVIGSTETDGEGNVTSYNYRVFTGYDTLGEDNTVSACVDTTGEGKHTSDTSYFKWTMGSEDSETVYYMPTFNMNKDSLVADVNGSYNKGTGVISSKDVEGGQYNARTYYEPEQLLEGTEIYDADENIIDEVGSDFDNLAAYVTDDNIRIRTETHNAKAVAGTKGLISMENWLALYDAAVAEAAEAGETQPDMGPLGGYWVYDTDGWVYWSDDIAPGSTTGLLLDKIEMTEVMDDGWYYALNVVAQFITANDMGQKNGTGFYDAAAGTAPTENALKLLGAIGVNTDDATPSNFTLKLMGEDAGEETAPTVTVPRNASIDLRLESAPNWLDAYSATEGEVLPGSAVSCFTISEVTGSPDGIGPGEETFAFAPYGQLNFDYDDGTISFIAVSEIHEAYEAYIVVSDGEHTWHGKIVVTAPAASDDGGETGGETGGGEAVEPHFIVTTNRGDTPSFDTEDGTLTLTYEGEATEFTFAFVDDDPDNPWTLNFRVLSYGDDGDYSVSGSGGPTSIREKESGELVATWDSSAKKLTMESGKKLTNCDITATKVGSVTQLLHIKSITNTTAAS